MPKQTFTPYTASAKEVEQHLVANATVGLSTADVVERREKFGPNIFASKKKKSLLKQVVEQLTNPIVMVLLLAVLLSAVTGNTLEAVLIAAIVLFMAVIGVYMENKADGAVEKLKNMASTLTSVIRDKKLQKVDSVEVVPGDLIYLQDGDKVPADARVIEVNECQVEEALLTGESVPVTKQVEVVSSEATIGDQKNMLFAGTFVVQGSAKAIVTAIAGETQIGMIAEKLAEAEEKQTPLQQQLTKLSAFLFWSTMLICAAIIALTLLRGDDFVSGLVQSLSLAIAFIPEGLTAVMTIVLALGVREMVAKQLIIKRLLAAEGLGSVSVIATDKTGTITTGKMTVEKLWMYGQEILPKEFKPHGNAEGLVLDVIKHCNNGKGSTEAALVNFLETHGLEFELEERTKEHRFSSQLKRMTVVHEQSESYRSYSKGAPDVLVELCSEYVDYTSGEMRQLDKSAKESILRTAEGYAAEGYRVLCLAVRDLAKTVNVEDRTIVEAELVFVGLICLLDPLREDVTATVEKFEQAGIMPIIITGDHPAIARTIALQAGVYTANKGKVVTGVELDKFFAEDGSSALTKEALLECRVFARVTPEHKELIIKLHQERGALIAMAGDGINDAVAISKANVGIAVADATDIVKEAADVVVTGSYGALANAIEVGRMVMLRTRLYLHYLLSGNFCQVGVFTLALAFNQPFPLTPIALLIINVLTDAAPAIAMAGENSSSKLLKQPPKPATEGIINRSIYASIAAQGLASTIYLFAVFMLTLPQGLVLAQTATFTAYIFQKLFRGFTARSFSESVFSYGVFTNRLMNISVAFSLAVWGLIVFVVPEVFEMETLEPKLLLALVASSLLLPVFEELYKFTASRLKF